MKFYENLTIYCISDLPWLFPRMINLFFIFCFFLLQIFLFYRIMSNSKRPREIPREKEGEASSDQSKRTRVTFREKEGEKATTSDRTRKEAMEVVEGMYIFYFLFKKILLNFIYYL